LLEAVKNLGRSERRALQSALQNAMIHLLKLAYTESSRDPENDWRHSVRNVRKAAQRTLAEQPSLWSRFSELAQRAYRYAKEVAHDELADSGNTHAPFPPECPWTLEEMLGEDFCPVRAEESRADAGAVRKSPSRVIYSPLPERQSDAVV
jgi:hypothetical protein